MSSATLSRECSPQRLHKSLVGTNVDRDYVELCSQLYEHWGFAPEVLKKYARHLQDRRGYSG